MVKINIGENEVEIVNDRFLLIPKARLNYFPHIGCIFIHIPKTGGTSISAALAQLDEYLRLDGVSPKFDLPTRPHYKHAKGLVYFEDLERDIWDNAFKFCVVRNPFEQMVSSYHWWLQHAARFPSHQKNSELVAKLGSYSSFINHELGATRINECHGEPEHWFLGRNGEDLVDFIVENERVNTLFDYLSDYVSVPKGIKISHKNVTEREKYSYYYESDDLVRKVSDRFRYVIDRFGYKF